MKWFKKKRSDDYTDKLRAEFEETRLTAELKSSKAENEKLLNAISVHRKTVDEQADRIKKLEAIAERVRDQSEADLVFESIKMLKKVLTDVDGEMPREYLQRSLDMQREFQRNMNQAQGSLVGNVFGRAFGGL